MAVPLQHQLPPRKLCCIQEELLGQFAHAAHVHHCATWSFRHGRLSPACCWPLSSYLTMLLLCCCCCWLLLCLQVRLLVAAAGLRLLRLKRVRVGGFVMPDKLREGQYM